MRLIKRQHKHKQRHWSLSGRALSRYYRCNHTTRMWAEYVYLCERMKCSPQPRMDFVELSKTLARMRGQMTGYGRRRGRKVPYLSHHYAWLYTPEERRKQNLACDWNCTMAMDTYHELSHKRGMRTRL